MLASLYMNTYNRQDNPVGKQNIFRAKYWSQQVALVQIYVEKKKLLYLI